MEKRRIWQSAASVSRLIRESPQFSIPNSQFQNWSDAPDPGPIYGRDAEAAQLEHWLVNDGCRVVAVLGMGGVGKTTLAASSARATAIHFDRVLWRSLLNAPPLAEVLQAWLQTLAEHSLTNIPEGLDAQLELLLKDLRQRRCLLVLDNLESILRADHPGHVRPDYEGYDRLIQRIAEFEHRSCLLLTSREQPQALARRQDTRMVRTLKLDGLDVAAGRAMLAAGELSSSEKDVVALVQRYSGNPLALKVVAHTVHELFGGNVAAFLAEQSPIFDDIRGVLDDQFVRLSPLEREIMTWLAIEREPIAVQTLREDLIQPSPHVFLEALRALQRRSLVGQSAQGLMLQNVVTQYVTDELVEQVCQEIADCGLRIGQSQIRNPQSAIEN